MRAIVKEDRTPPGFKTPTISLVERCKRPFRRFLYPGLNFLQTLFLKNLVPKEFNVDRILFGQRGNDYDRHRRDLNRLVPIRDKRVLIGGCGTGSDLESWLPYGPQQIWGVDYFCYQEAWKAMSDYFVQKYPAYKGRIFFSRQDLTDLNDFKDHSIDIFGCDAVFEHCQDLSKVLKEIKRVLVPKGIVYATFGPLYYTWGGDHLGKNLRDGFNHLVLSSAAYENYLKSLPETPFHNPHDGKTWIENKLFSYLKPREYLDLFKQFGTILKLDLMISPEALAFKKEFPELWNRLRALKDVEAFDLICFSMSVILQVPGD